MKTCTRCNGKLSTAARAAGSEVCTTCATDAGEVASVPLLAIFTLHPGCTEDWHRLMDRLN